MLHGQFLDAQPYGSGHINDTFVARFDQSGAPVRYIFQKINQNIFKDVAALMDNIERVTSHASRRAKEKGADASRRALTLVPTRDGRSHLNAAGGHAWRCYLFIENARTYDIVETPSHAREAARAFGTFQGLLNDLPGGRLRETIPDFHNTRKRFENFQRALAADAHNRAANARDEIDFALKSESMVDVLLNLQKSGAIPERITHNDTKINNVMLDDATHEGICVIDLDTVMPGLALYDFGDMVRSATNSGAEDERDLSKISMRMPFYEGLVSGYLSAAGSFLNEAERAHLAFSGKLITFEIGLRFLTDYLEGDVYFKTKRPGHNLDRCRTQFALARSIDSQQSAMETITTRIANKETSQ
ncbi:mucin desulfatase [Ereboglobus luteus]|uniref:Mucin desulfatase n=2 Tax=Ereboglobus luteus TaxID=1796921 RepID=A0A2U8E6C8_9BACT|nr:mucin desulfatase [Ereboglobus luteus]